MNSEIQTTDTSLSRRGFLSGAGIVAAGAAIALAPATALAKETEIPETADVASAGRIFKGVELSKGRVVHNQDLCSGCRTCEIVCSVFHEKAASSEMARMYVFKDVMNACITDVQMCKHCAGAECVATCPTQALHVDPDTGARVIDEAKCIGCQLCMMACPLEPKRIKYNPAKNVCYKCDLCGGDPQCVKFCPMGALTNSWVDYGNADEEESLFEVILAGDARTYMHHELATFKIEDVSGGIHLQGVVWTSHATQFNVINTKITIAAEFFDKAGNLIGTSDEAAYCEIPEMSSSKYSLNFTTSKKVADLGKVVVTVTGDIVTNSPNEEA